MISNVHSHPNVNHTNEDWGDEVMTCRGSYVPGYAGDWINIRNRKRDKNANFYIYYPNWKGLYKYTPNDPRVKIGALINSINLKESVITQHDYQHHQKAEKD